MFTKIKNNQSGFTLIDTVIGIMIISFVLPVILISIRDLNIKSISSETIEKGTAFANSVMHNIIAHRFDENYNVSGAPWTYPLGQDSGDSDDIDDFIGADWSVIPGYENAGYQAVSNVFYIDYDVDLMTSCNYPTNYKRIIVTVTHANLSNPIILTTIITPHGS
jgi:type II secretory pathway pseudopilin PulG